MQYLRNIMGSDAKQLYLNIVVTLFGTFNHAVELIAREYSYNVCQKRVKMVLNHQLLQDKLGYCEYGEGGSEGYTRSSPSCHRNF